MTSPRPGSAEALVEGCTCAVIDNHYGRGYGGDGERYGWFVTGGCPLHDVDDAISEAARTVTRVEMEGK